MYRQYENPDYIQQRIDDVEYQIAEMQRENPNWAETGICDDLLMERAELDERLNFAWQDDEFDCDQYDCEPYEAFEPSAVLLFDIHKHYMDLKQLIADYEINCPGEIAAELFNELIDLRIVINQQIEGFEGCEDWETVWCPEWNNIQVA